MDPDFGRYRWGVSGFSKGMEDRKVSNETIAILMAINSLSTQLEREIQVEDMEKELEIMC